MDELDEWHKCSRYKIMYDIYKMLTLTKKEITALLFCFGDSLYCHFKMETKYFNSIYQCIRSVMSRSSITRSTESRFVCLEPRLNRPQHKTNGALVHSNSSMIQLLLYDVITTLANIAQCLVMKIVVAEIFLKDICIHKFNSKWV